jgi:D-aminoacyl-tRNA deacylase
MKAVVQRVHRASVHVGDELVAEIGPGLLTLLGIGREDSEQEVDWLMRKITALRIFEDTDGKMNLSLTDVQGEHLIVSQFTLMSETRKGNRPSFIEAARPEKAKPLYEKALEISRSLGVETSGGRFQATMRVTLENDGPVTVIVETPAESHGSI